MNVPSERTVLVTGATGFIGTHLVRRLCKENGIKLVLLSRKHASDTSENLVRICSSLDNLSFETWLEAGVDKIDIVVHLGAFTPKSHDEADRVEEIYRDNLIGTRALLDSLPNSPQRIVFASTIDVYAPPLEGIMLSEISPSRPQGLYGASKLFCEQLIRTYSRLLSCDFSILRYGHIFGPGENKYDKFIPKVIQGLLHGESPIVYGNGSAERDYLYVDDAVEATFRAMFTTIRELGPINIVRGKSTQIRSVAEYLVEIMKFKKEIKYLKDKPNGYSLFFDNYMMISSIGEWEFTTLEDGLKLEVEYYKRCNYAK